MTMIQCHDGSYAPAVVVCVHLKDGTATSWCRIPSGRHDVEHDWLCADCMAGIAHISVDALQAICMHCARELREAVSLDTLVSDFCIFSEQDIGEDTSYALETAVLKERITDALRGMDDAMEACLLLRHGWDTYPFAAPEVRVAVAQELMDLEMADTTVRSWLELNDLIAAECDKPNSESHDWRREGF